MEMAWSSSGAGDRVLFAAFVLNESQAVLGRTGWFASRGDWDAWVCFKSCMEAVIGMNIIVDIGAFSPAS
jgi:hypothetical protein